MTANCTYYTIFQNGFCRYYDTADFHCTQELSECYGEMCVWKGNETNFQNAQSSPMCESYTPPEKCEITCLECHTAFSVNDGEDEINFRCPVCALVSLVREMAGLLTYRSDGAAHEILNRPKVKAIIREG